MSRFRDAPPPTTRGRDCRGWGLRHWLPVLAMGLVWGGIAVRLGQIHVRHGSEFAQRGGQQRTLTEKIPARPGDIVDRRGRLLATTLTAYSVYVNPSRMESPWESARLLAQSLDLPADRLFERLSQNRERQFLWVKRRMSAQDLERVRSHFKAD